MTEPHPPTPISPTGGVPLRRSLRLRLLSLLGAPALFTLLLSTASILYFVYRTEANAWRGRQGEAARAAAQLVSNSVAHAEDVVRYLAQAERAQLEADAGPLQSLVEVHDGLLEVVRLDRDGAVIASTYRDRPVLANLFTIPIAQWFKAAQAGERYYGPVQMDAAGAPYLIMALPAADGGVAAARLRMDVLWDVVADIRFGRAGRVYAVNQNGRIMAHTDRQIVLADTRLTGRPEFAAVLQAPGREWAGEYVNFEGRSVAGVSAPITAPGWIMLAELPRSEAYAASRTAAWLLGGGIALVLALATLWGRDLLQRTVLQPMDALRAGAERFGRGELDYRIGLQTEDEIGLVARAFDEMAGNLRQRERQLAEQSASLAAEVAERRLAQQEIGRLNAELEQRVIERTRQLEQANAELQSEVAQRARAEAQLTVSLREKEVLLKEIHHRVKNNMQIISSLLSLQSGAIDDPQTLSQFQDSQNRLRSMALIHERLYRSDDLARIEFGAYLRDLAASLVQTYRTHTQGIALDVRAAEVSLDIDTAIPCGLIVNELVSNALKHAFVGRAGGRVGVEMGQDAATGWYRLVVWDDGVGLPAEFDHQSAASLGLQLVNSLTRQLGGALTFANGAGTRVEIVFPEPEKW